MRTVGIAFLPSDGRELGLCSAMYPARKLLVLSFEVLPRFERASSDWTSGVH